MPPALGGAFAVGSIEMVYHAGQIARAEAVVDVDHGDAAGAGVQHAQQRGYAAERGAVAHAGGGRR